MIKRKTHGKPRHAEQNPEHGRIYRLLRWIWGALPGFVLMLVIAGVVMVLASDIKEKKQMLEAQKAEAAAKVERPVVNVVLMEVKPATMSDSINLPGHTAPWLDLTVLAEVRGRVVKKVVQEGDVVKVGDLLAKIDDRDYQNAWQSAKTAYETALSSFNRISRLQAEKLATRNQLDAARAEMDNAKAAMDNAALSLERCTIAAQVAGVVNQEYIEIGRFLNVGDPVFRIIQTHRLKVKVGIPESDVDAVRRINKVEVTVDALGGKSIMAKKHFLSKTAQDAAMLYDLVLDLNNSAGEIFPDMFVRVHIVKKRIENALSVPLYTVISRQNRHIVMKDNDGRAALCQVELGLQDGWRIQVTKGLNPGDRVIVAGHRDVGDDQPINVVRVIERPEDMNL